MENTAQKTKKQVMSFSCSPELSMRINSVCENQGWTKSLLLCKAIENYLMELEEDFEDAKIADKRWAEFLAGDQKTIPADDLYKELGL